MNSSSCLIFFNVWDIAKEYFGIDDGNTHFMVSGLIGAFATISHDAFLTPSDWIKQRMQLNALPAWKWLKKIVREEGTRALFKSYPVTLMMNIPFAFAIVSANENIKVFTKPKEHRNSFIIYFGCAFIAGMLASIITNPMDVVKTRLQIQHHSSTLDHDSRKPTKIVNDTNSPKYGLEEGEVLRDAKYKDIRHVMSEIYKSEGIHGFYKGAIPRMIFVAPGVAISWGTYEIFKSFLINESK